MASVSNLISRIEAARNAPDPGRAAAHILYELTPRLARRGGLLSLLASNRGKQIVLTAATRDGHPEAVIVALIRAACTMPSDADTARQHLATALEAWVQENLRGGE